MRYNKAEESIRERLLVAGIKELENHGFNDFSLRRVANICNVSCAAPYKHFKNKEELLIALMDYIKTRWYMLRDQVLAVYDKAPTKKRLTELCVAYVRFLLATPSYMTILTLHSDEGSAVSGIRTRVSEPITEMINDIFTGASTELKQKVLYSIRAYMYGTVCMIRNKEVHDNEDAIAIFRDIVGRIIDDAELALKAITEGEDEIQ